VGIKERSRERKERLVAHRARNFEEAEQWDLEFWQSQSPEQRLSALVEIHKEVMKVRNAADDDHGRNEEA